MPHLDKRHLLIGNSGSMEMKRQKICREMRENRWSEEEKLLFLGRKHLRDEEDDNSGFIETKRQKICREMKEGRWSEGEKLLFLIGLRKYGRGKWKEIGNILTTRSNIQIKSHGQKILARFDAGENVFQELFQAVASGAVPRELFFANFSLLKTENEYKTIVPEVTRKRRESDEYYHVVPDITLAERVRNAEYEWRYSRHYDPAMYARHYSICHANFYSSKESDVALALCELSKPNKGSGLSFRRNFSKPHLPMLWSTIL